MNSRSTIVTSALCLLAGSGLTHTLQQNPMNRQGPLAVELKHVYYEFREEPEPDEERLEELGKEGWDFAGLYGTSDLGDNVSLTLWKRPRK